MLIPSGEDGKELRQGTKHFRGGAKVYLIDDYPGLCEKVVVIGHHRASGRYIKLSMQVRYLEDFRLTTVYSLKVIELIQGHHCQQTAVYSRSWAELLRDRAQAWAGEL